MDLSKAAAATSSASAVNASTGKRGQNSPSPTITRKKNNKAFQQPLDNTLSMDNDSSPTFPVSANGQQLITAEALNNSLNQFFQRHVQPQQQQLFELSEVLKNHQAIITQLSDKNKVLEDENRTLHQQNCALSAEVSRLSASATNGHSTGTSTATGPVAGSSNAAVPANFNAPYADRLKAQKPGKPAPIKVSAKAQQSGTDGRTKIFAEMRQSPQLTSGQLPKALSAWLRAQKYSSDCQIDRILGSKVTLSVSNDNYAVLEQILAAAADDEQCPIFLSAQQQQPQKFATVHKLLNLVPAAMTAVELSEQLFSNQWLAAAQQALGEKFHFHIVGEYYSAKAKQQARALHEDIRQGLIQLMQQRSHKSVHIKTNVPTNTYIVQQLARGQRILIDCQSAPLIDCASRGLISCKNCARYNQHKFDQCPHETTCNICAGSHDTNTCDRRRQQQQNNADDNAIRICCARCTAFRNDYVSHLSSRAPPPANINELVEKRMTELRINPHTHSAAQPYKCPVTTYLLSCSRHNYSVNNG